MSLPTETERKYLIYIPEETLLSTLPSSGIVQTYLTCEKGATERVRMRTENGVSVYTHTKKVRISPLSSTEDERTITEEEYHALLSRTDTERKPIHKTRYLLFENGFTFEIDVFPFWKKQAYMEVELSSEQEEAPLPKNITVIREVTGNRAYSNAALALVIPDEDP